MRFTREPQPRGTKLYGPFANPRGLRGAIQVLQKVFKFRTCSLDIDASDPRWRWFRPCLLHSIDQCTAPCNLRISKEEYRKDIRRLQRFLEGGKNSAAGRDARGDGRGAPANCTSRRPPGSATKSPCSKRSTSAARWKRTSSRRSFPSTRSAGWPACGRCCIWPSGRGPSRASTSPTWAARKPWRRGAVHRRAAVQAGLPADADSRRGRARRHGQHPRGRRAALSAASAGRRDAARHPADRRRPGATQRGAGGAGGAGAIATADGRFRWPSAKNWSSRPRPTSRCA